MHFGWIIFVGSLTAFLSYFLWKDSNWRCINEASSLSVAINESAERNRAGCTCSFSHSRKGPFDAEWDGHIYRSASILLFLVISPSVKTRGKGLAHATMSLILIVLPPVGKTKTSTPCKARAWGGAGGAAPPHPHHFLKNKKVNKIKYSGTSI